MVDIQYDITIMGGREVSRPYRVLFFAEGERFLSFCRCHRPRKRAALVMWCGWFKPRLEIRHAAALTTGAKHWHRQKAVFYVFVFDSIHNSATLHNLSPGIFHWTQNKGMTYSFSITGCIRNLISGGAFHAWFKTSCLCFLASGSFSFFCQW